MATIGDMLDQLFEGTYYNTTSFSVALFSLLLAFALSTIIAFTYRFTVSSETFSRNFFQAIVLSSMVSSMVIMAVGNNIAVGFGIIGAIAIIRFRTIMRNPKNIIFIFAALSVGVATGIHGYAIALAGTSVFCVVAALLRISPYGKGEDIYYEVRVDFAGDLQGQIETVLGEKGIRMLKQSVSMQPEGQKRVRYELKVNSEELSDSLFEEISAIEGTSNVRVSRSLREMEL